MAKTDYRKLNQRDIWKLISQSTSGIELAKLWLLDSWEVDHGRPEILSPKNIERIQKTVASLPPVEVRLYDSWLYAYRILDYTILEARLLSLEVSRDIYRFLPLVYQSYVTYQLQEIVDTVIETVTIKQPPEEKPVDIRELFNLVLQKIAVVVTHRENSKASVQTDFQERIVPFWQKQIGRYKAYIHAIEVLGSILGLPVQEDLEGLTGELRGATLSFDSLIIQKDLVEEIPQEIDFIPIDADKVEIDKEELSYLEDRLSLALGNIATGGVNNG